MNVKEALELIAQAEDRFEVCPNCGEVPLGIDYTEADGLYFIHEENGMFVSGCGVSVDVLEKDGVS